MVRKKHSHSVPSIIFNNKSIFTLECEKVFAKLLSQFFKKPLHKSLSKLLHSFFNTPAKFQIQLCISVLN